MESVALQKRGESVGGKRHSFGGDRTTIGGEGDATTRRIEAFHRGVIKDLHSGFFYRGNQFPGQFRRVNERSVAGGETCGQIGGRIHAGENLLAVEKNLPVTIG